MAKSYIVIKNGREVVGRVNSKQAADALAQEFRDAFPRAGFEFGKLDKKYYSTEVSATTTPQEESY